MLLDLANFDPECGQRSMSAQLSLRCGKIEHSPKTVDFDLAVFPAQTFNVPFSIRKPSSEITRSIQPPLLLPLTLDPKYFRFPIVQIEKDSLVERFPHVTLRDLFACDADLTDTSERYRREVRCREDVYPGETGRSSDREPIRGSRFG